MTIDIKMHGAIKQINNLRIYSWMTIDAISSNVLIQTHKVFISKI